MFREGGLEQGDTGFGIAEDSLRENMSSVIADVSKNE
jgi:hypothetical protein